MKSLVALLLLAVAAFFVGFKLIHFETPMEKVATNANKLVYYEKKWEADCLGKDLTAGPCGNRAMRLQACAQSVQEAYEAAQRGGDSSWQAQGMKEACKNLE